MTEQGLPPYSNHHRNKYSDAFICHLCHLEVAGFEELQLHLLMECPYKEAVDSGFAGIPFPHNIGAQDEQELQEIPPQTQPLQEQPTGIDEQPLNDYSSTYTN